MKLKHAGIYFALMIAAFVFSGCTSYQTFNMNKSFGNNSSNVSGVAPVIVAPIEETIPQTLKNTDIFNSDPTFLGEGLSQFFWDIYMPLLTYQYCQSNLKRTDIVLNALKSNLNAAGLPYYCQTNEDNSSATTGYSGDGLNIKLHLRELSVDTDHSSSFILIIVDVVNYNYFKAHAVIDCEVTDAKQKNVLWEGTVEAYANTKDFNVNHPYRHANIVGEAVYKAIDQLFEKSQLVQKRNEICSQRYDGFMNKGREMESLGNMETAMSAYGMASLSAITTSQDRKAYEAMARLLPNYVTPASVAEDVHKYKVQAEDMIKDKNFVEAEKLFDSALKVAPWWPAGHFNRALILSELSYYPEAIREMNHYVALVPNAPDVRTAQDKIYTWETKSNSN